MAAGLAHASDRDHIVTLSRERLTGSGAGVVTELHSDRPTKGKAALLHDGLRPAAAPAPVARCMVSKAAIRQAARVRLGPGAAAAGFAVGSAPGDEANYAAKGSAAHDGVVGSLNTTTASQQVPGLIPPALRRAMNEVEVDAQRALRAQRRLVAARLRSERLLASQFPNGVLDVRAERGMAGYLPGRAPAGGHVAESSKLRATQATPAIVAPDGTLVESATAALARSMSKSAGTLPGAADADDAYDVDPLYTTQRSRMQQHAAKHAGAVTQRQRRALAAADSMTRRGYDVITGQTLEQKDAEGFAAFSPVASACARAPAPDALHETRRGARALLTRAGDMPAGAAPANVIAKEGDLRMTGRRRVDAWISDHDLQLGATAHERLFAQPEEDRWRPARAQALVDQRTRGRGFDIVTGSALPRSIAPAVSESVDARSTRRMLYDEPNLGIR